LLNSSRKSSERHFVSIAGLCRRWFTFLVVCSLSALAQNDLREQSGTNDIRATVKQMTTEMAQSQSVAQNQSANQVPVRIFPYGSQPPIQSLVRNTAPAAGVHLTYWGGPVISNMQVVVVLWGPNVVTTSAADGAASLSQFYTDITSSRYFDLLTEYSTAGITGHNGTSTSNQSIGHGSFATTVTITPAQCPTGGTATTPCIVTDAQIQTELANQINNTHALPGPQTDAQGDINTYYAIYFPPNTTIELDPTTKSCVSGGFCAYHSTTGSNIPYGVMADFSSGLCSTHCGAGTTTFQVVTGVSSHEMAEAVTDSQVGLTGPVPAPPLGWYDPSTTAAPDPGEIADICDPPASQTTTVTAGSHNYTVEPLFSNLQNDCVTAPPVMHMPATGAGPGVQFNLALTVQNSNTNATLSGYTGTVHFTSSDVTAVLPADYTFVAGDAGSHTFQFTLNTPGAQTISVVDTRSGGFTGTADINVSTATDLTTSASPGQITALQGATGLTYATTIRNNGGTASSGTVTLIVNPGSGLNPTALSGTGWSCTLATLICTRADALASGASYPDVTLTFNISATAANSTTSISSTVSGGGDANLGNNTANATVNIGPVVSITSSTPSATVVAGGAAQYTIGMTLGATAGSVTFNCAGLPTASTCAFSPTALTSSGNVTMVVATTARGAVVTGPRPGNRNPWLLLGLLSLAAMAVFTLSRRTQARPARLAPIFATCALILVGIVAGCGGGGSSTNRNVIVGTPQGTYTLTFTATSANGTASKTMTLIVN
jgi:hypothetical protein